MTEPSRDPDAGTHTPTGGGPPPRMPLWVKVTLIALGALIALFLVLKLTGSGSGHGPGRHMGSGDDASLTAVPSAT